MSNFDSNGIKRGRCRCEKCPSYCYSKENLCSYCGCVPVKHMKLDDQSNASDNQSKTTEDQLKTTNDQWNATDNQSNATDDQLNETGTDNTQSANIELIDTEKVLQNNGGNDLATKESLPELEGDKERTSYINLPNDMQQRL
ncbi:uncharacterized protein LOC122507623 isoform X2 [Leptopilina heterotoma]|nr:uncharacterized protein LOC122507623 isoform X2 [Leptopilina heterotoma]